MSVAEFETMGLPAGRYEGRLTGVEVTSRRRKQWVLKMTATIDRNGVEVVSFRPLSTETDPLDITAGQRKGLREFAERLDVQSDGPVEEIIAAVKGLIGEPVMVRLRPSPMGVQTTLYRGEEITDVIDEPHDTLPKVAPDYRDITVAAQDSHEKLLMGLRHARRGLMLVAEACWELHRSEGWVALAYDSIGAYLADPEVTLSRSDFYAAVDIYETYCIKGGADAAEITAGSSKLTVPLKAIKEGTVTVDEALADAESLGLRDLREKYRAEKPEPKDKPEPAVKFPIVCMGCGSFIENQDGIVRPKGIEYRGHAWPEGWSHEQILAAFAAGEQAT